MIRLAPIALLILAALVPQCSGTVWGNMLLLLIVCGIFLGTIALGQNDSAKDVQVLPGNDA